MAPVVAETPGRGVRIGQDTVAVVAVPPNAVWLGTVKFREKVTALHLPARRSSVPWTASGYAPLSKA